MAIQKITSGIIQDGAVAAADIVSVANTAITGNIISSQITSVANTQLTGLIQAAQIGSANATLVTSGTLPAAALPAGSVLQVVSSTYGTQVTNSTTTYADTGLTATITPTRNTSKILVLICHAECQKNGTTNSLRSQLLRGVTVLASLSEDGGYSVGSTATYFSISGLYYDSPATTSATTYKTQFKSTSTTSVTVQVSSIPSTITLMEIAV